MRRFICLLAGLALAGCAAIPIGPRGDFAPRGDYPQPPRTQLYAEPGQCRGGSRLGAIDTPVPDYPRRAWANGLQGWVIVELDVGLDGRAENVSVLRQAPGGWFGGAAERAVRGWRFLPPAQGALTDCLVRLDFRLGEVSIGR